MRKQLQFLLIITVFIVGLEACSSVKPYYSKEEASWESQALPDQKPVYSLFLIGDAGEPRLDIQEPTLKLLQTQLANTPKSSVVFLGDNVYPSGMPDKDEKGREQAEKKLNESLKILKDYQGDPYFIPGNHDWYNDHKHLDGLKDQQKYIEDYLDKKDVFLPKKGRFGPEEINLDDNTVLILIDSYRWIHDIGQIAQQGGLVLGGFRSQYYLDTEDILKRNTEKNVILAMHHPIFSNGNHGGYFSFKDHLFPLTAAAKNFYFPLPIIGSLYPAVMKLSGSAEDIPNLKYQAFRDVIFELLEKHDNVVVASGHEHNLQYHYRKNTHFIVSGAGSKATYARKGKGAGFTHTHEGFVKLSFYEEGETWMEYWEPNEDGSAGEVVFKKQLCEPRAKKHQPAYSPPPPSEELPLNVPDDSTVIANGSDIYGGKKVKRFFLGQMYRDVWATEAEFPVIQLNKEHGGLTPLKRGGGYQTKSLRLMAADGRHYVLRSVEKDVSLVIPKAFRGTIVQMAIQDGIAAANPYAALAVPDMADAVGVFHANPKVVWLPDDPALGKYREAFKDELYLYEERPAKDRSDVASFGSSENIVSSFDMYDNIEDEYDHVVDQKAFARARLFDVLLGDWDRHEDQWRWASFKENGKTVYRPIPRDRDQAFVKYDGVLPWFMGRRILLGTRKLKSFNAKIVDMKGLTFNGQQIDRKLLTELELEDWLAIARDIQEKLTDEVIDGSFDSWPKEVQKLEAERIKSQMKQRRDDLIKYTEQFYKLLAREVEVIGTNKRDLFEVERVDNETVTVKVYELSKKKGKKKDLQYERTFKRSETKEIQLYGLKEDDRFEITGKVRKSIKIRIIGGKNQDEIFDESKVTGLTNQTFIYDTKKGSEIEGKEVRNLTRVNKTVNAYVWNDHQYNSAFPAFFVGFNVDDGVFLGGGAIYTKQGFRKVPYHWQQSFVANVGTASGAYNFIYNGDFIELFGKLGLNVEAEVLAPNFVNNFFGLGNETLLTTENRNFNRIRYTQINGKVSFQRVVNVISRFNFGGKYNYSQIEDSPLNQDRISGSDSLSLLTASDFEAKQYAGVFASYGVNRVDNPGMPYRGIRFNLDASYNINVKDSDMRYGRIASDFAMYYTPNIPLKITLAAKFGIATNFGDYEFFQSSVLGNNNGLRGYRNNRFQGRTSFYQNNTLRIQLADIKTKAFPFVFGLIGFFDTGRVWLDDDPSTESGKSDKWHHGYGGGIFFSPAKILSLTLTYSVSEEERFVNFGFGFFF